MKTIGRLIILALVCATLLTACGKKGPVRPRDSKPPQTDKQTEEQS